jgi:hypothetical protein
MEPKPKPRLTEQQKDELLPALLREFLSIPPPGRQFYLEKLPDFARKYLKQHEREGLADFVRKCLNKEENTGLSDYIRKRLSEDTGAKNGLN